jgi:uncharacterized protein (TIGR00290 family)
MKETKPIIFAWSGGKDSALALNKLLQKPEFEVRYLLSTFNGNNHRLSMHGVRLELIQAQADALGIPLITVEVFDGNNIEYEKNMAEVLQELKKTGVDSVAFGDIFLEDLRLYREQQMDRIGMKCIFPLWKSDTAKLANEFIGQGFKSIVCCADNSRLDKNWCGRMIDKQFIRDLPAGVDPCGENGEYHSFCFDGPIFRIALAIKTGELVHKNYYVNEDNSTEEVQNTNKIGFWFVDLLMNN